MSSRGESPPISPQKVTNKVNSEISVPQYDQEGKGDEVRRSQWGNKYQFILSALGLAVGLGNIWRFPYVAYENGGSAFLIPYLCCSLCFGLPMVYAEFMMGQYSRSGPGLVTGRYAAGFRGVGWTMTLNAISVAIYYCVIIAWAGVYLAWVFSGQSWKWTECGNYWNTRFCVSQTDMKSCSPPTPYFFQGTCWAERHSLSTQPSTEFFTRYVTIRSGGITELVWFNYPTLISLVVLWALTALILIKGIKIMGYLSYILVPFPYVIVCILFFRGITLDNAWQGIEFYLFKPDFSKLFYYNTWAAALTQMMFSMCIGYGGLISLSSYNKPSNNFFRDSLFVVFGDTLMSLIGGVATFSILGYLAGLTGKKIEEVVADGVTLAFIVYPEAIKTMGAPWLWNGLFFFMLCLLGVTSEIALVESFTGVIFDCFPATRKRKWLVTLLTCAVCMLFALVMVTWAGFYWFNLLSDFTGAIGPCVVTILELFILSFYGWDQVKQDLVELRGMPRFDGWKRWIGPRSPLYGIFWATVCPLLVSVLLIFALFAMNYLYSVEIESSTYKFPIWADISGWIVCFGALIPIPAYFIYKLIQFKKQGIPLHYLLRPSKELPSYSRYYRDKALPDPETVALRHTRPVH